MWISIKQSGCLTLFISSPPAWIWASLLKCRQWQLCQQPYFSREQKPSLFSTSHSISSLPTYISAPNCISPDYISGMKSPWGQLSVLQTHLRVNRMLSGPNHCVSSDRGRQRNAASHSFYMQLHTERYSESPNELRKLIPDQWEIKYSCLSFICISLEENYLGFNCESVCENAASWFQLRLSDLTCQSVTLTNHKGFVMMWLDLMVHTSHLDEAQFCPQQGIR